MKYSKDSLLFNRRKLFSIILAFLVCCTIFIPMTPITAPNQAFAAGDNANKFYNPIKTIGNDPWVYQKDGYYYLIESWDGGIWIYKSPLNSLTRIESGGTKVKVWTYPTSGPNCSGIWAPELHYINNKWYIYYAGTTCDNLNDNHRMFVLEGDTQDPLGSYTDKGKIYDPSSDKWAIDGHPFTYGGNMYFIWSGWPGDTNGVQNNYIAPMSDPWTISGPRVLISTPEYDWEKKGGDGTPAAPWINEGPTALINGNSSTVNIVYSASGSWTDDYCYGILTNTTGNMLDPDAWVKKSTPVFSKTSEVFGPGHGSFVKSPDGTEDWMIYHSARKSGSAWDRIMNTQKFTWNTDNTPNFGSPVSPSVRSVIPSGQPILDTYDWGDNNAGTIEYGNWTYNSASAARSEQKEAGFRKTFRGNSLSSATNYTVEADAKWLQPEASWGNSGSGTPVAGDWSYWSQTSIDSTSLGSGWHHTFRNPGMITDYVVTADAKWVETGTSDPYPKYGIYAIYKDSNNYAVAMIDKVNNLFTTSGVVNGVGTGWQNTGLPAGTDLSTFNTIKVVKKGTTFEFYFKNQLLQTRTFNISDGQVGLATVDTKAHFINMSVSTGVAPFPKYGIYAIYKNSSNHVIATIDQNSRLLATFAVISGAGKGWLDTPLPAGIDLALFNKIKVVRSGNTFDFYINGIKLQSRTLRNFNLDNGQVGLITEDTKADFINVTSY
jgi:GH43 family beta-xylosidase